MAGPPVPLTAISGDQRAQAHNRFTTTRPLLEDGISQVLVVRTQNIPASTIQRWVKGYREKGLACLEDAQVRSDKGKSRRLPAVATTLIESLALQAPPRSIAAIHCQVSALVQKQGWKVPSSDHVRQIIKSFDLAFVTLARQGAAASREEVDLLYRCKSCPANVMWQADHTSLDVWLLGQEDRPAKRYFTAIEDDYRRMIMRYRLSFRPATALTTTLILRQALWQKEDLRNCWLRFL